MSFDNTIDFKDHIVRYPNRFKQTAVAPGVVELVPTWITNSNEIIEPGTPVDSELFKKLKQNVTIYQQTFTTTENQTIINLNRDFLVGQNRVSLSIGGVRQYSGQDYTETDSHTLTMTTPQKGGLKAEVIMFTASQAIAEDFFEKTVAAIAATQSANDAASQALGAKETAYTVQLTPVTNFAAIATTYPSAVNGSEVQTLDDGKIYRKENGSWVYRKALTPGPVSNLMTKVDNQRYYVSVREFGAIGDGVTDDTAAIRNAIAATPKGGTLFFPPTTQGYLVSRLLAPETFLFLIDKPINILGLNSNSTILLKSNIPNTVDVFLVQPQTAGENKGYTIKGITVVGQSSSVPARHAIHIDLSVTGARISNSQFSENLLYPTGGRSIKLTNPTNTDGFFTSQIEKNLIYSGIELQRAGDSLNVLENTITGYNKVDVTLVDGSNTFVFAFNNVTCRGGIRIGSGHNMKILFNNIEAAYADTVGSNGALLDIDGVEVSYTWGLLATEVRGNNFTYRPTAPDGIHAVRINKARSCTVETNHIALKNSNHILITSLAAETILGYNLYSSLDPAGVIVDNGARTLRKDSVRLNANNAREVFAYDTSIFRTRTDNFSKQTDKVTYDPKTKNNAVQHVLLWNEANTFNSKHVIQSQKQLTNGTTEAAKAIAQIGDGYMYFSDGGFALVDPSGFRWKVTISTSGALTTTRMS